MSTGTTVQVIGAVVDVEFPAGQIPKIYDALIIDDAEITHFEAEEATESEAGE